MLQLKSLGLGLLLAIATLLLAAPLSACLWEQDTLAQEAEGIEDVVSVILGAFPRNPDLYYEMRLTRSEAEIAADPTNWDAYDNAGVAADRLGQSDKAIAMMEAKSAAMEKAGYDGKAASQPNHSYRTKANLGTFYAHRWFHNGRNFLKLADIDRAVDLIRAAIEENPDAHFGREKYQLMILEWLAANPSAVEPEFHESGNAKHFYPDVMGLRHGNKMREISPKEQDEMMHGLAGLMKMGAAWRSLDVLHSMQIIAARGDKSWVFWLIDQRINELKGEGLSLLLPTELTAEDLAKGANPKGERFIVDVQILSEGAHATQAFSDGRAAVENWHQARLDFMLPKLKAGQHPDTHPDFWKGFANPMGFVVQFKDNDIAIADAASGQDAQGGETGLSVSLIAVAFLGFLAIGGAVIFVALRRRD